MKGVSASAAGTLAAEKPDAGQTGSATAAAVKGHGG